MFSRNQSGGGNLLVPFDHTGGTVLPQGAGAPIARFLRGDSTYPAFSGNDTVHITSSDTTATLPADASLLGGTVTVSVTLNANGTFTITASDVTIPTRTANTGSPTLVNP